MNTFKFFMMTFILISSSVFADIKPYIEGQLIYFDLDDVDTKSYSGTTSGITYTNARGTFDYDSDITGGLEIGVKGIFNDNFRIGLAYSKPNFELDSLTLNGSITDGVDTLTGPGTFTPAQLESVGLSANNDAKSYMFNLYYDFDATNTFKPFIGAGLGITDIENAEDKEFTYAAMAGAKYYFNDNVYFGGKFSYTTINGPKDKLGLEYDDIDLYSGTLMVGLEF
jgi:opacity protein-like surface antigen